MILFSGSIEWANSLHLQVEMDTDSGSEPELKAVHERDPAIEDIVTLQRVESLLLFSLAHVELGARVLDVAGELAGLRDGGTFGTRS